MLMIGACVRAAFFFERGAEILQKYDHGGNVYEDCPTGEPWLDFSANINPLGLSPLVREAILSRVDDIVHYPDPEARGLKEALPRAARHILPVRIVARL